MIPSAASLAILTLSACAAADGDPLPPGTTAERTVVAMGTTLRVEVVHADRPSALRASEAALRAVEAVEARLSTWTPDSELARLNQTPVGAPFALSAALEQDLCRARSWCDATTGAFDPGVGRLVELWGLRSGGRRPDAEAVETALAGSGMRHLRLEDGTATRLDPALRLEEGAFGKGAGLDAAAAALVAAGAHAAVIDLGGQVLVIGPGEREFGVADPRDRDRVVCRVRIGTGSLATTGNSERGVTVDGERIGHVLDPRTGRPAEDFGSVTVWAPDAFTADCLATGLFVMGPERALRWAEARPSIEALVIETRPRGAPRVRATSGLRDRILLTYFPDPLP